MRPAAGWATSARAVSHIAAGRKTAERVEDSLLTGRWLVLVDLAAVTVREAVYRALRNLGVVEILPCVYRSKWLEPDLRQLQRILGQARRRGVGRLAVGRLKRRGLIL